MADMPGRNEFSADEEKQMRADQRRDAAINSMPLSTNIDDRRREYEPTEQGEASMARALASHVTGRRGRFRS